jgi:hypothetical protein
MVQDLETFVRFTPPQKQRTILRSDAGFGSDANINFVLAAQWQVLTKNKGGRRPEAFARQIPLAAWQDLGQERWVASVVQPVIYVQPTQSLLLRWLTEKQMTKYAIVVCSVVDWSPAQVMAEYDDRGACETEFQGDKTGLQLERRRKKHLAAQEALILLTDLAHNLLAWCRHWMFVDGALAQYGALRLTEDVLCLPGRLLFEGERLVEVHLNQLHPHAADTAVALQRLLDYFGHP